MPRPQSVSDDLLYDRLIEVFSVAGFQGASLGDLAQAAQLRRASLYHRFPEGKKQMAEAILDRVEDQLSWAVEPMTNDPLVAAGIVRSAERINRLYAAGANPCVLDSLSLGGTPESVRRRAAQVAELWISAMATAAERGGYAPSEARRRAVAVFVQIQGSLSYSRMFDDRSAFVRTMAELPQLLIGEVSQLSGSRA